MWIQLGVVAFPAIVSVFALYLGREDVVRNIRLLAWSSVLTALLATPWLQGVLHVLGQHQTDVVIPPVFPVAYLLWGRFDRPSVATAFSGTFITLFLGDIVSALISGTYTTPWWTPFTWIGGAGLFDGLLLIPIASALAIWYVAFMLKRGHTIRFLFGRKPSSYDAIP